jgi:hypothetical protein
VAVVPKHTHSIHEIFGAPEGGGDVSSVNGLTGAVVLDAASVGADELGAADAAVAGSRELTYPAAVTVSGQRVVLYSPTSGGWIYADRTIPAHAGAPLAVTIGAIVAAASGAARISGVLDEPSWSWPAPCPLWLDTAGQMTATPPTSGFLREIARAVTPTRIVIEPEPAINLA